MIQFCKTDLGEEEKKAIADCIDSGWTVLGPKSQEFEEKFAEYVGAKYAIFVDSGTSALYIAHRYLAHKGIKVTKVPSLTFVATAEIVAHKFPKDLCFLDVNEETFCVQESTADMIPVNLLGNKAPQGALMYDSAHRIEKNDVKGSDALWCYSFYATKNMTTVTGGMIATNDIDAYAWLKRARDHGLTLGTKERYQGSYKQYDVDFVGWRVKGDDLRAVIGIEQLKKLPSLTQRRNEIVEHYNKAFDLKRKGNHVYPIFVKNQGDFVNHMYENNIQCTVHFRPLHQMNAYKNFSRTSMFDTEYIGKHIVSLPLYPRLTKEEVDFIIRTTKESGMLI